MVGSPQTHPDTEQGNPLVDMRAMAPTAKLDDPGIGLRDNGRKVLTYAQLRSAFPDPDGREPSRTIELHLTGHMDRFAWSFNGVKASQAPVVPLTYGERVRFVLHKAALEWLASGTVEGQRTPRDNGNAEEQRPPLPIPKLPCLDHRNNGHR